MSSRHRASWVILAELAVIYVATCHYAYTVLAMHDFGRVYYGTAAWLHGGSLYAQTAAASGGYFNLTPPQIHLLYLPFALLPPVLAYLLWQGMNLAAVLLTIRLAAPSASGLVYAVVFASAPLLTSFWLGQPLGLLSLLGLWLWRSAQQERWMSVAFAVGLLASWKPSFALLGVALLARGQIRAAILSGVTCLGLLGLGLSLFGRDEFRAWLQVAATNTGYASRMNASLMGAVVRITFGDPFFLPSGPALRPWWTIVAVALIVPVLVLSLRAWRTADPDRWVLTSILTTVLVMPIGWVYYLTIGLAPVLARRSMPWWAFGLWVPFSWIWLGQPSGLLTLTLGSVYTWGALLAWISLVPLWGWDLANQITGADLPRPEVAPPE